MLKRKTVLLIGVAFLFLGTAGCNREGKEHASKRLEPIVVAVTPWPGSAAIYVAAEKGHFREEGLDAVLHPYLSGHLGLDAVLSGTANLATVGDTPVARAGLAGKPVAIVATLCEINRAVLIVARKDRGISSRRDLKGKKVGVVAGTTADFFLHIFLATSYIRTSEVTIVPLQADRVVDTLVAGDVDAVSTWSPHTIEARDRLGENAAILEDPSIYKMTWNLATGKEFALSHPQVIERVLRAIVKANGFILKQPDEARAVTSKHLGKESARFEKEWADYTFTASLDQSLLLNLEDQARWMIGKETGSVSRPPNFMDFVYTDGLKSVRSAAVGITGR